MEALIDVRVLRMLRIFLIPKLGAYVVEYGELGRAIMATRRRIAVFLSFVVVVVVLLGTLMYVVEGPANGYTSIPVSIYWANVSRGGMLNRWRSACQGAGVCASSSSSGAP